jgi:hypothetical protein
MRRSAEELLEGVGMRSPEHQSTSVVMAVDDWLTGRSFSLSGWHARSRGLLW